MTAVRRKVDHALTGNRKQKGVFLLQNLERLYKLTSSTHKDSHGINNVRC